MAAKRNEGRSSSKSYAKIHFSRLNLQAYYPQEASTLIAGNCYDTMPQGVCSSFRPVPNANAPLHLHPRHPNFPRKNVFVWPFLTYFEIWFVTHNGGFQLPLSFLLEICVKGGGGVSNSRPQRGAKNLRVWRGRGGG